MTMTDTIRDYARRPKQAAEADGLNDIQNGIVFLAMSGMWYANSLFTATIHGADFAQSRDFRLGLVLFILALAGMLAVSFGSKRYIKTLRERFVYPRLGYVAQTAAPALRQKLFGIALSVGGTLLIAAFAIASMESGQPPLFYNSGILPALLAGFGGGVYLYQYLRLGFARHLILGCVVVAAASVLPLLKLDDVLAIRCMTIFWGICSIVAGAVTFSQLLRTPPITDGVDEIE